MMAMFRLLYRKPFLWRPMKKKPAVVVGDATSVVLQKQPSGEREKPAMVFMLEPYQRVRRSLSRLFFGGRCMREAKLTDTEAGFPRVVPLVHTINPA